MKLGEFFVTLGVNADTLKVREFVGAIGNLPIAVAGGIAALAGIQMKMLEVTREALEAAVAFKHFSTETGLSWQELQKWQIVAEQASVSTESVAQSVGSLQRNLAEIRMGRGNISPFQILGISANQNAFQVLEQIRQRIKGMDKATAFNLVQQMGLSPDMIHVLQLSDEKFAKFSKTVSGMSVKQQEALLRTKERLIDLGLVFRQFTIGFVGNLVMGLESLIEKLSAFQAYLPIIAAGLVALGFYFAPVTAGVIALLLVLEDLAVFFAGGDSLTGDAVKGLKMLFDEPLEAAKVFLDTLDKIFEKLAKPFGGGSIKDALASISQNRDAIPGMLSQFGAGLVSPSIVQQNQVDIRIDGSQTPVETARAVKAELERGTNAAALQTDNSGY